MNIKTTLIILFALIFTNLTAKEDSTKYVLSVNDWLTAGPVTVKKPAFTNLKNVNGKEYKNVQLLKLRTKKIEEPKADELFLSVNGKDYYWTVATDLKGFNAGDDTSGFQKAWQAVYLHTDRFIKVKIKAESRQCFELYVDGKKKLSHYSSVKPDKKPKSKSSTIHLERGKHLLIIKSLYNNKSNAGWDIRATVSFSKEYPETSVTFTTDNKGFMDIHHLMDGTSLTGVSASYDGKYIMLRFKKVYPPDGKSERWFEIRDHETGKMVYSSVYASVYNTDWVPGKNALSFIANEDGRNKLVLLDLDDLSKKVLLDDTKKMGSYHWSPTGDFIIYSVTEEPKKDKDGVIRVVNPMDRWPWWRKRGQLFKCNVKDGAVERLTYGYLDNNLQDISPDGKRILFSQSIPDFEARPYTRQIMMELDLETMEVDTVWNQNFGGQAEYSPDGKKLLVQGSASMFNGTGVNIPKKLIPNDYDTQAYIYDLKTQEVTPVTKDFNPSVQSARWLKNGSIIFKVEDKTWNKLYRYDVAGKTFTDLKARIDMVNGFDIPLKTEDYLVYYGSSMQYPKTAWICGINGDDHQLISDPSKDFFEDVIFGKTENWNFRNKSGRTIEGRVYYPPDYDESKKYPVIVYYYGGTSPTGRSFGGRYPKNLFAAQGYIVYVLQPSGATGFGQEFSALHVNNWGETVADEIILGTKTFLKEHPSADPSKVGCIGASYGGFMTMLLTTRTDIFAAAIEHAGISSISSYWGEGYWGYLYSSVASANSFPWNNKKLYVDQSPLFNADKVNTPLLLLHGKADTNVPVGESIQMFTALKLLGKPVELVEIEGQDHHITDYKKRILWQKTIFAWFDKWLKDQKEWWDYLYPKEDL
jgi:dipeptidyl aminopeptidase/acylaminoacyl peptidase